MTDSLTRQMIRLYESPRSMSLAEIGEKFGMSRQAVQQRLDRAGVERRDSAGASRLRYEQWVDKHRKSIERALRKTRDHRELAEQLGVPIAWVRRFLEARFGTSRMAPQRRQAQYSDEEIVAWVSAAAAETNGEPLTQTLYDEQREEHWPTSETVIQRFGNWGRACRAARVKHRRPHRTYSPVWTKDAALEAVRRYVSDCRTAAVQPVATDYEQRWRRANEGPSLSTVRKHFGSWRDALWAVLR